MVSHALTQWNIEGRIQGHTDVPLNYYGRKMAGWLAKRLTKENIQAVYTSDLKRAYQTAIPLAEEKFLKIIQDIRLREGRSIKQERSSIYPTLPFCKEVETKSDLLSRMKEVLSEIALVHNNKTVLVVSHGGSQEIFIKNILERSGNKQLQYQGIRMAVNRIKFDAKQWGCIRLDDF